MSNSINVSIELNGQKYRELRCTECRKLICLEYIFAGRIAFVCPRCGHTSTFNFKHLPTKETQAKIKEEFEISSKMEGGEN